MAANNLIRLLFAMSYNDLVACCIEKEAFLTQDVADLAERGITLQMIADLETERVNFVALPANVVERNTSSIGFAKRNVQTEVLRTAIHVVYDIAKDTFKEDSSEIKSFNVIGLAKMDCNELSNICSNIIIKSTLYTTKMTVKGLKPAMLTNITTQAATLLPLIAATPTLVGNALGATVVRRTAANSLYTSMKGLCHTGHAYYIAENNKLKAENYVIYDEKSKIVDRNGTVKSQLTTSRKTVKVIATTPVRMKVKNGKSLVFYYGMNKNSLPSAHAVTVANNPNIFIESTAEELGYNLAGGIIHLIIYNPNAEVATFLVKIG